MADILVVQSKVKALAKKLGYNTSAGAIEALSKRVEEAVKAGAKRAKANRRKTIKEWDI
jgi:histone H3/H4